MKYWWIRIFDYKTDEELKEYEIVTLDDAVEIVKGGGVSC